LTMRPATISFAFCNRASIGLTPAQKYRNQCSMFVATMITQ
jgi:hypothetical protein